ncbi:MAG: radical SAM protein [Elusimicrobiales bacterium]
MPDIALWNKCNNKCVMCTNMAEFARQDGAQYGLKCQIEKLERYLKGLSPVYLKNADKADFISLTGGEPTLHPEFFKAVAYFRRRLPAVPITLLSNGRAFASAAFTRKFVAVAAPPFSVAIALHGPTAAAHDQVAGVRGSFAQTLKGLRHLLALRRGQQVEIRLVLHKKSIARLHDTLRFLLKTFPDTSAYRVVAIHYEIEGMSELNHKSVGLKFSVSSRKVDSALPLIRRFADFRLYHFPLCQVRPELRPLCRVTLPSEDRVYPAVCRGCRLRRGCLGLMLEYYKKFGDAELKPVRA